MDLTRGTPSALLASISGPYFHPIVLAFIDWPGEPLRAHSGRGDIVFAGQTWIGVGRFGGIEVPDEAMSGVASEFRMSLVTDFPDIEPYTDTVIRGRVGQLFLGATQTPGGNDLIGAVEIVTGTADGMGMKFDVIEQDGQTIDAYRIEVTMTTGPSMRSAASVVHSNEDQRRAYPNDTAGRHLILAEANAQKTLWPEP